MLHIKIALIATLLLLPYASLGKEINRSAEHRNAEATYSDIKKTLGIVPDFLKMLPEAAVPSTWETMKSLQLSDKTALNGKTKELIGLGVAAQIPCKYCVYFHTEAAKLNGASQLEIREAIMVSALARHWSTVLNGNQIDEGKFRNDADRMISHVKSQMSKEATMEASKAEIEVVDTASAYKDIENTFGFVPEFVHHFPKEGIASVWSEAKAVLFSPHTALSGKTKDLIGLAVDAQIPCKYCVYFDTESAKKLNGANDREITEAVAMAAATRHWSTVLNGLQIDEKTFRKQTDQIMRFVRSKMKQMPPVVATK